MNPRTLNVLSEYFNRYREARGYSHSGARNMYQSCGYPQDIVFQDYRDMFDRGDIAKTIISAYPNATWVRPPIIRETEDVEYNTPFEKSWQKLIKQLPIFSYLNRVDVLCGIGSYGCLFLGFDDGLPLDQPVKKPAKLMYLRTFAEGSSNIAMYDNNANSLRYGLPEQYTVTFSSNMYGSTPPPNGSVGKMVNIHWSRIIHIADNKDESEVYGVPRLTPLYNRLLDCQKVLGCSAEMFWSGAFQGLSFEADSEADVVDKDVLEAEIQKYVHGLQRYMQLQGIQAKVLQSQVASPQSHIDVQMSFISAATRIPLRILTGSERGELSSNQDDASWKDRVEERRNRFAQDEILRPFINRLVEYGTLAPPTEFNSYRIEWNDVSLTTQKTQMETARLITDALRMYLEAGIERLMSPEQYFEKILHFNPEVIAKFENFKSYSFEDSMRLDAELKAKSTPTPIGKLPSGKNAIGIKEPSAKVAPKSNEKPPLKT